jgi:hypothetical protein
MQTNQFNLDVENIKKALPLALGIAAVLAIVNGLVDIFGSVWGIILLAAWAYIGIYYTNLTLNIASKSQIFNIGINAAILAAIAAIAYRLIIWVVLSVFRDYNISIISLYFLEAGIIGGLAAIAWFAYKTNSN